MSFEKITNKSLEILAKLPFPNIKEVLKNLLNYIEDLRAENEEAKDENQRLKDENSRLKGEKGKPDVTPFVKSKGSNLNQSFHLSIKVENLALVYGHMF